ncbi:MAG: sodium:proton antiporter [Proteobacteria bacterium]|nr:sodium:proton antiporter [Pseudomonadota bacterium]
MELIVFQSVTVALVLGVTSYIMSRWLRIPAILFYLFCGLAAGRIGLGIIDTNSLGNGLHILLEIAVAIILFEGGLSLSSHSFKSESSAIRRILIITIPLTGLGGAVLARHLLDLSWQFSLFFGALIVVTGPTVVGSILKSVYLPRRLEILLNWESIWGDVIGVLLSAVALELVDLNLQDSFYNVGFTFVLRLVGGIAIGVLSGYLLTAILGRVARLRDSTLLGIVAMAGAIATFYTANVVLHSSGPLAVAVSGFYLSNLQEDFLHEIRHFKEQVSSLFISTMFVLLSAYVNPLPLIHLWPMMIAVAVILGALVRPLSVLAALFRTDVDVSERVFLGVIGPRGIIAVATAAYASMIITGHETEMSVVLNLTFAIIFFSGTMATVLCRPLARVLGVLIPVSRSGVLIVGINPLSSAIAEFASRYVPVSFLETNQNMCRLAAHLGLETICTDILNADIYEDALEDGFGRLLAVTRNDALNELVASKAAIHLDPKMVYRVPAVSDEDNIRMVSANNHNIAFSDDFSAGRAADMIELQEAVLKLLPPSEIEGVETVPLMEVVDGGKGIRILQPGREAKNEVLCFVPNIAGSERAFPDPDKPESE